MKECDTNESRSQRPLAKRLRERIEREGLISFRDWMECALYDPHEGYYCRTGHERWGRAGDYRTSPERSPLFAATFARYFAALYEELGAPEVWTIFEAGAGRGDFALGVLLTLSELFPRVFDATLYVIDEASADANARLKEKLADFESKLVFRHLAEFEASSLTGVIFSNELLDAFPVHRVIMRDGQLLELCVCVDDTGAFVWVETEATTERLADYFESIGVRLAEGQVAEVNLAAGDWIRMASTVIKSGFLITVDYGHEAAHLYDPNLRPEGTLRAFQRHRLMPDALVNPGKQDLTTSLDWTYLKHVGQSARLQLVCFERQDKFLLRAGLLEELARQTAQAPEPAAAISLQLSAREMILPGGMSASFQVLIQKKNRWAVEA
jgi:SAM-dependent MidA family methyltransferase